MHILLLCKEGSVLPLGNDNGVCAFGILEPELDRRHESQALLWARCVVVFDELDNRCNHILLGHLVVFHVAFPEPAVEALGLDYAIEGFHRRVVVAHPSQAHAHAEFLQKIPVCIRQIGGA
ncbi:hypothetical protein SDC9_202941 [bioreactor metagenome]|uniref:Uncharacterized protein n=1 Tax=bioreactor metagenome TaxID=1076179 RepID=A0A645IWL0_9ZZZZ